ncbi:beta-ketoacyl synthase chain length factor [Desulfurivibrio sp. D14AmB]|uniref:beta-ketoacyl synthase chain length factor n=1 Tax=Desulfurivibrio sp. D14AmB TaxID=3374370 RepID=UPI00376ED4C4
MSKSLNKGIFIAKVAQEIGEPTIPADLLRDLRRADLFIQLAVLAGSAALGPDPGDDPCQTGVFLGTTTGPLDTNFAFLDSLFDNGESQASPTLFSHSVHNAAAGYLARLLNLRGPAQTITTPGWPFLAALAEAKTALELMPLKRALVLAVEEESPVLVEAAARESAMAAASSPRRGAVAWLLTTEVDSGYRLPRLTAILVEENHSAAEFYLRRQEEAFQPDFTLDPAAKVPAGLAPALALTQAVEEARPGESPLSWTVTGPCGRAAIRIER